MKHPRLKAALLIAFLAEQATMVMLIIFGKADAGMQADVLATLKRSVNWWTAVVVCLGAVLFLLVVHSLYVAFGLGDKLAKQQQNDRIETNQRVAELRVALTYETTAREYIERSHVPLLDLIRAQTKAAESEAKLKESFVAPTLEPLDSNGR